MKLARFYRDGELSDIRVSSAEDVLFEVHNLFAGEELSEDAVRDMILTKNTGVMSHVDELRLDFNRIFRKREIRHVRRCGAYAFKDSFEYCGKFSTETILNIKNEQRYLSACFSDYMVLIPRFGSSRQEPYLFASLKNGYYYLLNAEELPPSNPLWASVKKLGGWILKKISFKTSTR